MKEEEKIIQIQEEFKEVQARKVELNILAKEEIDDQ